MDHPSDWKKPATHFLVEAAGFPYRDSVGNSNTGSTANTNPSRKVVLPNVPDLLESGCIELASAGVRRVGVPATDGGVATISGLTSP
jgi:elongation factor P hydroxylase